MLKEADTNLATSTQSAGGSDAIGIVISYVLRVRLYLGAIGGDLTADVPFKLCQLEPGADPQGDNKAIIEKQAVVAQQKRRKTSHTYTCFCYSCTHFNDRNLILEHIIS